jgi:hypothetical protein
VYCKHMNQNYSLTPFFDYANNIYSQNGEDGILFELLNRIRRDSSSQEQGLCVEFGAWDGIKFSNTFRLVEEFQWRAFYIEGDSQRYQALLNTASKHQSIVPIKAMVNPNPDSTLTLDRILASNECPKEIDILSIDVDSCDLDIWESLEDYRPKVVVIEINSSLWPGIIVRQAPTIRGNSFSATLNVAKQKGYTLVCHTGNMIFVANEYLDKCAVPERFVLYPELLFNPSWLPLIEPNPSHWFEFKRNSWRFLLRIIFKLKKELKISRG